MNDKVELENVESIVTSLFEPMRKAGDIILDLYGSKEQIEQKEKVFCGRKELVTEADTASNNYLMPVISNMFPNFSILSEENYNDLLATDLKQLLTNKKYTLFIDPNDGSDNKKDFTVMTSLLDNNTKDIVFGIVYKPITREMISAIRSKGAFLNYEDGGKKRLEVTNTSKLDEIMLVTSQIDKIKKEDSLMEQVLMRMSPKLRGHMGIGSGGNKMAMFIASGNADLYIRLTPGIPYWDLAPGHVIVQEAGGKIMSVNGSDITYDNPDFIHKGGIIATNGLLGDLAQKELKEILMGLAAEDKLWAGKTKNLLKNH
jgi:myo-inositol-1(or 4)-monophosphatase